MRTTLSASTVRRLFRYDGRTGVLSWRKSWNNRKAGTPAGAARDDGSIVVTIDGRGYSANRLVWLYVHGEWPDGQLTYLDGDPSNLRLSNIVPRAERLSSNPAAAAQRRWRARIREEHGYAYAPSSRLRLLPADE